MNYKKLARLKRKSRRKAIIVSIAAKERKYLKRLLDWNRFFKKTNKKNVLMD